MKTKHLLLLGLVVAFSSCSTAYRTGQTPDDVYYSPAPPQNTYVRTDNQEEKNSYGYNNSDNSYNSEDMEIRRGIRNPRYRDNNVVVSLGVGGYNPYIYDPYGYNPYGYNPYSYNGYGHYGGYNSIYYNPYDAYSSNFYVSPYYNYYYSPQVYTYPSGGSRTPIAPRRYNLGAYNNNTNNARTNSGYRPVVSSSAPVRTFTSTPANNGNGSGVGNLIRRVFTPDNNSSNNRSYRNDNSNYSNTNSSSSPVRSTQTSSGSSSTPSASSSSAPVRTFRK